MRPPARTRRILLAGLLSAALLPTWGSALAQEPEPTPTPSCSPFSYSQSYRGWGPALAYDRRVRVSYAGDRCVTGTGEELKLTIRGSARISDDSNGRLLEVRSFEVDGSWRNPSNQSGWPLPWWRCAVKKADYSWRIPGVYAFEVTATNGRWSLRVSTIKGGVTRTVSWQHNACR